MLTSDGFILLNYKLFQIKPLDVCLRPEILTTDLQTEKLLFSFCNIYYKIIPDLFVENAYNINKKLCQNFKTKLTNFYLPFPKIRVVLESELGLNLIHSNDIENYYQQEIAHLNSIFQKPILVLRKRNYLEDTRFQNINRLYIL